MRRVSAALLWISICSIILPAFQNCTSTERNDEFAARQYDPAPIEHYDKSSVVVEAVADITHLPSILGKWLLVSGRDTVIIEFDSTTMYVLASDTIRYQYRLVKGSITVYDSNNGKPSSGHIRSITVNDLMIDWDTGDTNHYVRP